VGNNRASLHKASIHQKPIQGTAIKETENLTESYEFVAKWGSYGSGAGQFINPRGIAVDTDYVYVVDSGNNRIQKFTRNGEFVMAWGSPGSGDGQFNNPQGIAVNRGIVYMTDSGNKRVQKFY
jgi:tripartite motif-containing protein 71